LLSFGLNDMIGRRRGVRNAAREIVSAMTVVMERKKVFTESADKIA
jgi:hypothetical protein